MGCTLTSPIALEYELMQYFGGVLEIKRDTNNTKPKYIKREHESSHVDFSSKRICDQDLSEPRMKKQKADKDNCFEMELMIKQLTTVVR